MMATKKFNPFEKSKADKEPKGMREGSKKEMAFDKKQMKAPAAKGKFPAFKKGGKVC